MISYRGRGSGGGDGAGNGVSHSIKGKAGTEDGGALQGLAGEGAVWREDSIYRIREAGSGKFAREGTVGVNGEGVIGLVSSADGAEAVVNTGGVFEVDENT